jgi:hypothetical protein
VTRELVVLGVVAVALAVAACTGGHVAPPPTTAPPPATTTIPPTTVDYTAISLAPIAGSTTIPTIAVTPGQATLGGSVVDDTGAAVPGATVDLQRIVGSSVAESTVSTGSLGNWTAHGIAGGVYRVRAWRAPDLSETVPQVVFLGATQTLTVNLTVSHFTGLTVQSSVAPDPPIIGQPATIAVLVSGATVGNDGVVRAQGQGGVAVQLFGSGSWAISGDPSGVTSSGGYVTWQATCTALGPQPLQVLVDNNQTFPLSLPDCAPVPTTTTVPPTSSTTSTTVAGHRGGPTTTR